MKGSITSSYQVIKTETPLNVFNRVKDKKTDQQKNDIIIRLIESDIVSYWSKNPSMVIQKQIEDFSRWCISDEALTQAQRKMVKDILSIDTISTVCVLSLHPVFIVYIIGEHYDLTKYDQISDAVVSYEEETKSSANYIYLSESEFHNIGEDEILKIYRK